MLHNMIETYNRFSFTHNYIIGFEYKGIIYYGFFTSEILPYILNVTPASRGCGMALRYRPNNAQRISMLPNCEILCSAEYFNALVKNTKYNRGEIFEKIVTERNGQEWKKDNVPFTVAGDIVLNGTHYQIKYEKATFINEAQIDRLSRG